MMIPFFLVCCVFLTYIQVTSSFKHIGSSRIAARKSDSQFKLSMSSKYLGKDPVFIAGGSSGVGLEVIKRLSTLGTPVQALVRRESAKIELEKLPNVTVFMGDALDETSIQSCMNGCIAAITTLGGHPDVDQAVSVDYVGNSNVIEQAGILGVERIILVTSIGCGATSSAIPASTYLTLENILLAKTKAERDLKTYTNLDWTILRPGGLHSGRPTGQSILTADPMASGSIDRADAADLIVQVLGASTGLCTRRELSLVDPTLSPDYDYTRFPIQ